MTRRLRTVLPAVALSVLAVTGCLAQPQEANDNGPQPDPVQPGDVVQTPAAVDAD